MEKDFQLWYKNKEKIHYNKIRPFFDKREVWFCVLGVNVGFEQDGSENFLRPVLIIRKFNNEIFWGLPLTKKLKKGKYYYQFLINKKNKPSTVILSQIRLIDAKRLQYKIGDVNNKEFEDIKKRLIELLQ